MSTSFINLGSWFGRIKTLKRSIFLLFCLFVFYWSLAWISLFRQLPVLLLDHLQRILAPLSCWHNSWGRHVVLYICRCIMQLLCFFFFFFSKCCTCGSVTGIFNKCGIYQEMPKQQSAFKAEECYIVHWDISEKRIKALNVLIVSFRTPKCSLCLISYFCLFLKSSL